MSDTGTLGPGLLTIGTVGSEVDVSCLVNSAKITSEKDQGDNTTKLCGTVKRGSVSYSFTFEGNVDVDAGTDSGLFALSGARRFESVNGVEVSAEAAAVVADKKNVRLLVCGAWSAPRPAFDYKRVNGGLLVQDRDTAVVEDMSWRVVTRRQPTAAEMSDAERAPCTLTPMPAISPA